MSEPTNHNYPAIFRTALALGLGLTLTFIGVVITNLLKG